MKAPGAAIALWGLCVGVLPVSAGITGDVVRVTGDHVNLRSGPGPTFEVVAQVSSGERLVSLGEKDGWVRVVPPEDTDLWVYGDLVEGDIVAVPRLNVRGGPGINYKTVGRVREGTRLKIRGKHAGWLQIAPPEGTSLWISKPFVTPDIPEPAPEPPELSGGRSADASSSAAATNHAAGPLRPVSPPAHRIGPSRERPFRAAAGPAEPPPIAGRESRPPHPSAPPVGSGVLADSRVQGRPVEKVGWLRPAGRAVWRRPSRYRLVEYDRQGRALTVCFVTGDARLLDSFVSRRVRIKGKEYWMQGLLYPVLSAETVTAEAP